MTAATSYMVTRVICFACDRELPLTPAWFQPGAIEKTLTEPEFRPRCRECRTTTRFTTRGTTVVDSRATAEQAKALAEGDATAYGTRFRAALADEYAKTAGEKVNRWLLAYSRAVASTGPALMLPDISEALRGKVLAELRAELG